MYAHIQLDSHREVTERASTTDPWDQDDTYTEWFVGDGFIVSQNNDAGVDRWKYNVTPITFEPEVGDIAFMLYAVYDTGCSFGTDEGAGFDIIGVFDDEDEAWAAHGKLQGAVNQDGPVTINIGGNSVTYRAPWTGYFEKLRYLEVKPLICEGKET
jgi:hypothetical protein